MTIAEGQGVDAPDMTESAGPTAVTEKVGVGALLRAAREALGFSQDDLSEATRIAVRHVQALERGDWNALPAGRPYAIGFSRSYARKVGLDETTIAEAVRAELAGLEPHEARVVPSQFDIGDPVKTAPRSLVWLSLLAAVMLVAGGFAFWRHQYSPAGELPSLAPDAPATQPAALPVAQAPAPPPAGGQVVFTATEPLIWVKFYDGDGKQLMQKQMALGETYTVPADAKDPKVWTGRPDALTVTVGGKVVPKLSDKQVRVKDVPVTAAALLARPPMPTTTVPAPAPTSAPTSR